jgi:putative acetyltransferase
MSSIITEERPDSPDALKLLSELDAELWGQPYTPESRHAFTVDKLLRERVAFFVVRVDGEPAACGGLKIFEREYGEVKRMYCRPTYRGQGLGKAILNQLADYAMKHGLKVLRLETGIYQVEAIGLYKHWGFQRRSPFGEYKENPLSVYLEKVIA